ncbi:MAG: murein biosynthesis integral membrane protein MurJ [bacterium]
MLSRILNGQSKSVTGAAILISCTALASRLVGLFRERMFAHHFRASEIMDAYYTAFKMPDMVYNLLIVGAISAGFIPIFTKLMTKQNQESAWRLASNILNILGSLVFLLTILGIIYMPKLIPYLAPGFDQSTTQLAVSFGRIMFISMLLLSISMIMGTILQSLRSFLIFSIAPIFYNVGIIFGVVVLVPYFGIKALAWGVVLGALIHLIMQTYGAYAQGYRWKPVFDFRDKETLLVGKLMIPRTLSLAVSQINIVIFTIMASLLPVGSIAIFNYANNLQGVPTGIIGIPFALAVFPVLSAAVAENDEKKFIKHLSISIRQVLFLVVPISLIFLLLRAQIVRVVLGSGAFTWSDTINTADTLAFFVLSLFAQSLIPLFCRAFYALENTKTPFVIAIISELVTIIAALLLMKSLGVAGLALAFSIGAILNLFLLAGSLRGITGSFEEHKLFSSFWRIAFAGLVMASVVQYLKYPLALQFDQNYFIGIFLQGLIAGVVGLFVYCFICYLLRVPEFLQFKDSFKRKWLRLRKVEIKESVDLKN